MRLSERQITDIKDIENILKKNNILHLAFNNGEFPYMVTVNYGYYMVGNKFEIYFHGGNVGEKHEVIARDNRTAFEIDGETAFIEPLGETSCSASFAYESIIGTGFIEGVPESEKEKYLTDLMHHFGVQNVTFNKDAFLNTKMYRIKVLNYTAKRRENKR